MVYIPPLGLRFSLLGSPPEQVGKAEKPGPSSTIPLPCPKEMVVKVQEESPKGVAESKDRFRTMGRLVRTASIAAVIYPGSLTVCEEKDAEKSSRSKPPLVSASRKPRK